uniref:leucine-rich repeat flightless-interacting protein 1-like n=1 Tax=Pristiophorus japonicus TaxID=55135 RepID=UPI00398E6492
MATSANSRRRILSREISEDENMMMVIKEADAKFNARKASFAEAKEVCAKKLLRQQQEIEELLEKQAADQDTQEDLEEKYFDAVQSIGHLETEKTLLVYEVERLRDILEGTEEELAELHRKHREISRELETEKVAKHVLQQKINCLEEQLEERKKSKGTEIATRENMDKDIQRNLEQQGSSAAKKMEFKSDNGGKHTVQKLQGSAANLADVEQQHSASRNIETESNRQHKTADDISTGKHQEGRVNVFTQQSADDACVEEATGLIKDSENVTVREKVSGAHRSETERDHTEDSGSEVLEPLELRSEEKDTEYQETEGHEEKEQKELILEVSKVASEDTVHKREMNGGDVAGTREEVSSDESLNNTVEGGVRKQAEGENKIMMEVSGGKNLEMVKEKTVEVCGSMTEVLQQVSLKQDDKMTPGESRWEGTKEKMRETVALELSYQKMDNEAEEMESGGEDLVGGRAQDKWPESGRKGGEVITLFQFMKETASNLVKDSVKLKRDVWLDKDEQQEGMHGKEVIGDEAQSQRDEEQLENENPVKNPEMDRQLQGSVDKVNEGEDSSTREQGELREGENAKEKVKAREGLSQGDNREQERNESNVDLDTREQKTVMDGQAQVEGKETPNESGTEQNVGKEKRTFEMFEQLIKKLVRQKSFTESEGNVNRRDHVDGYRGETDGQNEEYVRDGIEGKKNDLSRKGLVEGVREQTAPEGDKAAPELLGEAEVVDDLSDEEMHDAAESIAPEPTMDTPTPERKPNTEEDPEGTITDDDVELREDVRTSESTKRHLKHRDTCRVS